MILLVFNSKYQHSLDIYNVSFQNLCPLLSSNHPLSEYLPEAKSRPSNLNQGFQILDGSIERALQLIHN